MDSDNIDIGTSSSKRCTRCGETKPIKEFPRSRGVARSRCNPCHIQDVTDWAKRNAERRRAYLKKYYRDKNPDKRPQVAAPLDVRIAKRLSASKKWRDENREKMKAARDAWNKNNPHKVREKTRRYQVAKRLAVPVWADKKRMASFYSEAAWLSEITGTPHDVDHIIPIKSDVVCGLHCEYNLRVIPASVNRRKNNKLIEDVAYV